MSTACLRSHGRCHLCPALDSDVPVIALLAKCLGFPYPPPPQDPPPLAAQAPCRDADLRHPHHNRSWNSAIVASCMQFRVEMSVV